MGSILIDDVNVFDGTGTASFRGSVLVEDDRISIVRPTPDGPIAAEGIARICGRGKTLLPGLVEAHAHVTWPASIDRIVSTFRQPIEELTLTGARNLRVLLDHGFTSAFSAGALAERVEVVLRDEIAGGWLPGPRLKASTTERGPGEEGGYIGSSGGERQRGPEALRAFVRKAAELGVDSVKLLLSGEDALSPGASQKVLYTEEEVQAAADEAQACGIWLAAHTQAAESIKVAVRAGVRVLYHCSWADEEALDLLEEARDRLFVAPAIGVIVATLEANPPPHVDMRQMKAAAPPVIEQTMKLIPELRRRGVRVLPGGDYGFPFNPNGRNARDLQHFVDLYGYTPAEALSAATMLGGQLMGMESELGLVRPGYLADLLLVDGDPTQDVSLLQDSSRLPMIMKGGALHKGADLVEWHVADANGVSA